VSKKLNGDAAFGIVCKRGGISLQRRLFLTS
jgi:hypothetical protein